MAEFARRIRVPFSEKLEASSATPEDIILSKLQSYEIGKSEKHFEDIRGILRVSGGELDMRYLREWSEALGVSEGFRQLTTDESEGIR